MKLKELSYLHAEGYPAGELKHGSIALIDKNTPVIFLCDNQEIVKAKIKSNMDEIKARKGLIYVITNANKLEFCKLSSHILSLPAMSNNLLSPILFTIPMQMIAYNVALLKGYDIDKPRNLAKSVTVE